MLVLAPLGQHIGGYAQGLYRRYPLLQGVRVVCDDLNQGVHIVKILAFSVHSLLQVQSGADGVPQFLKILTGITHILIRERLIMVVWPMALTVFSRGCLTK